MRKPAKENARELSPKALAELKENAQGVLSECRRQLLAPNRSPFIGSIAMNLEIKATRDRRNPTASTDGKNIYFDIDFLSSLSPEDRLFIFAHEIWHNVMCHFSRMGGNRDQELVNIAEDLEVNQLLREDGYSVPKSGLLPGKYNLPDGKSAEEYYELLVQQQKKNKQGGGQGKGRGAGGGGGQGNGQGQGQPGKDPSGANGNQEGKLDGQFDKHITNNYNPNQDPNGQGQSDKYGKVGEDPDFNPNVSPEDMKKNQEKMRELAVAAAQQVERSRGSMPAHLKRIVKDLLEPEIPWQEMLIQFVTRAVGDKNRWSRPNRRFVHQGLYLPSKEGEKIKIAVGVDTSGSTAGDIKKFLSEINAIVKNYGNYEVHLIQCDWEVQDYTLYNDENPLDLEHMDFQVHGGGGTQMKPIFDYINEHELDADCIAIFTDGFVERFTEKDAPDIPTLWVVTEDGCTDTLGFGEVLKFKNPRTAESEAA